MSAERQPEDLNLPELPEGYEWELALAYPLGSLFSANPVDLSLKLKRVLASSGGQHVSRMVDSANVGTSPAVEVLEQAAQKMVSRLNGRTYQARLMDAVNAPGKARS